MVPEVGFQQLHRQMGEFSKMLNMIADLLNAIKMAAGLMPSSSANRYLIRAAKSVSDADGYRQR